MISRISPFFPGVRSGSVLLPRKSPFIVLGSLERHSSSKQAVFGTAVSLSTPKQPPSLLSPAAPPPTRSDERFRKFNYRLSQSSGPIEIFKAPSHRSYILGAYSIALFCFMYSGYNFYATSVNPLMKVAKWQEYTFGGICVAMGAMGAVFFLRGGNLIASITAKRLQGQTQLSIKVRRMLPFLKQREILVTPEQLSFSRQLVVPHEHLTEEGRIAAQKRWESQRVVSETPFYKAPLKKINLGLWMFFMNTRRLFTQEHFVYTKIAGKKSDFRMDTMGTLSPELFLLEKGTRQGIL